MCNLPYDKSNAQSILEYAKHLEGHTFYDVLQHTINIPGTMASNTIDDNVPDYTSSTRKGGLGNLLEEQYFFYKANSDSGPDFPEAGLELKVTPYETKAEKSEHITYKAGERLVLTMISFSEPITQSFYHSHLWNKCKNILLILYHRDRSIYQKEYYPINYVSLFTPSVEDLKIIEEDYVYIQKKIESGHAEQLSEADTIYLGACTKGATAESSLVSQYYNQTVLAKKRAFCYKISYMTIVINSIIHKSQSTERIIKNISDLENKSFTDFIVSKINSHIGKTDKQLCYEYDLEYTNNKAQWINLAFRMIGISSNKAEEFEKANIKVKAIRINNKGKMEQNMSFPPFEYLSLIDEKWDTSSLHDYFDETKFLFVVFRQKGDSYVLKGCQFWNMPYTDLNTTVKAGWQQIVNVIKEGIKFSFKDTKNGIVVENNLPGKKDNEIIHIRPHATTRYYRFPDGRIIGNGNPSDSNPLPDGTIMPNYSFWINNDYILKQLDKHLVTE